ncbi:tungsten ABC transporter TupABC, ATP-binding protein [Campylobacter pinnipediorum subsp. caledonicus]|uniref:Tungsten ABC transporter TupABC, ATP-binding protein n=1 Tax=Campylobacter pinnipediorum subsp. caledonicus TaxID=1874362 RepID=A0A1S6U9I6_9BACT|nr:tungstate ABC transporter ATP-binding protein TupC [Campylobacter pinnipediorum]AQW86465.1 tungsten ABC transporter TupABC, ATP-binding protein [Campylobacter pinnipediorum subsp. caledonicus]AQW88117.1 tungsten ABC transporter TupABC, ATP-binding protein [Campylobacter pinnipediorum subsp. caledonicus]OPA71559.1 tungsten ABC transporter ATP-binding protein [Campylobacter pinnipediorum subsp. caledonicus]
MIEISNLKVDYGNFRAIDIEKLNINTNSNTALLGFNGSGKSTLLKAIAHLIKPTSGSIKIWGKDRLSLDELKDISILLPEPMLLKRNVIDNFKFALKSRGNLDKFDKYVYEALELVGLDDSLLQKQHYELSSGQNKRIAFALIICLRAKLNLLDEPTNAVDLSTAKQFAKAIQFMKDQYKSGFIIASHDEKWLSAISDQSFFLHEGRVSEFELKNIFNASNGIIDFGNFKIDLPKEFKNSKKIAINQNLINLSFTKSDDNIKGVLHSVSLIYKNDILLKIKAGDFLIKCVVKNAKIGEYTTGKEIFFSVNEKAFLSLE